MNNEKFKNDILNLQILKIICYSVICAVIFVIYAYVVNSTNLFSYIDTKTFSFIANIKCTALDTFFNIVTHLGSAFVIIPIILILCILNHTRKQGLLLSLNVASIAILGYIIKRIYQRARPNIFEMIETGYSFPSAHTTVSFVFYSCLIYFVQNSNLRNFYKITLYILLVILALGTAFSRIYLGVHYLSDVCGGILLSIEFLICSKTILNMCKTDKTLA